LIGWDKITRRIPHRWAILFGLFFATYVTVDLLSNRSPAEVFISYLTFNQKNSYNRVHIWHFGIAEILRHPFFGIGFNEWQRLWYMSTSMDNFWLQKAVRYGIPTFGFLAAALIALCASIARLRLREKELQNCRLGWFISFTGMAIAGATVNYWNAVYCLFMFLIGSGVWMLDCNAAKTPSGRRRIT
jgi:O-antigen ligase